MKEVETATFAHFPLNYPFEKYFPNLKVLDLSCMRYVALARILRDYSRNRSCSSGITTLTLPNLVILQLLDVKIVVELVGKVFDKLTTLVMFDAEKHSGELFVMRAVFYYIQHIEYLTIILQNRNVVYLDNMLTGLAADPSLRTYPSLAGLTKLKTLTLTQDPAFCEAEVVLTDLSVNSAFMHMPALKSVTVRGLGFYPTSMCVDRLRDRGITIEIHN
jgi:hypothetical protein